MKFTLSWLKEHLDTQADLASILEKLTSVGLEVEGVENPAEKLKPFVIAEVLSAAPHPQADKLQVLSVDPGTGQVTLRGEFPNPKRELLPGMYVRARLEQGINEAAITVPQQAIVRGAEGASVMIVGADNKVVAQPVKAEASINNRWVVSEGLKGGERIIVEGFQKAKPGAAVTPQPWQPKAPANGAGAGTAAAGRPAAAAVVRDRAERERGDVAGAVEHHRPDDDPPSPGPLRPVSPDPHRDLADGDPAAARLPPGGQGARAGRPP